MNTQISSLVEDQLPGFIVADYENFGKILQSYYEHLESPGNPLDIITNLTTYHDIDYYEKNLLQERTILANSINSSDTTIIVTDASSFPKKNGYIKIENEICFYKERTDTEFLEVSRGVSGTTQLGDLYSESKFITSSSAPHSAGVSVDNLSNLFLYGIVKSFEKQYLESFPEAYLKENVDKRTLIKNISNFYKVKGTDKSIRFIFNTIVSKSIDDIPTTYNPKDQTLKVSESDWDSNYGLQVVVLSGQPEWLFGQTIVQRSDNNAKVDYASAVVENFYSVGEIDGQPLLNLILNSTSLNSEFTVPQQTVLTRQVDTSLDFGDTITVDSTFGWRDNQGVIVINGEIIKYEGKTLRQFVIKERGLITRTHLAGDTVTSYSTVKAVTPDGVVSLLIYGILTRVEIESTAPFAMHGDRVQLSNPGFETLDPVIYDEFSATYRWKVNTSGSAPQIPSLAKYLADVAGVYQDNEYYYIATSSYPSTPILNNGSQNNLSDPQLLKLIPKNKLTAQEVYKTPRRDVAIFVDGSIGFSYKDEENIAYGPITKFNIVRRGSGYQNPPYVLVNGEPGKARAILTGDTVTDIISSSTDNYTAPPVVEIVTGRNAVLQAVVTSGEISSIRIINPGQYYSSPPAIIITDIVGKGRLAEYRAVLSNQGQIIDAVKIDGGKFYTQENVRVSVIPDAFSDPASATSEIRTWIKNRYLNALSNLDTSNGCVVPSLLSGENYYGIVANPKRLRYRLNDNLDQNLNESIAPHNHSPILGFAYDGNPIYGPYGYSDPLNKNSSVVRLQSGYVLQNSRTSGPIGAPYPMGTFIDDYKWIADVQTGKTKLDKNNGRFCVTPEYPNGIYAYFITIDSAGTPVFPYILGENFYNIPVESNYQANILQSGINPKAKRLFIPGTRKNGYGELGVIEAVSKGFVENVIVEDSQPIFNVGCKVYVDDAGTGGSGASGFVSSTFGKTVTSLESKETKAVLLSSVETFYAFSGDIVTQNSTGATGQLIRDVIEENSFVLRNVSGTFAVGQTISATSEVLNLLLSQNSTFTQGATLSLVLFDDPNVVLATGVVLAATSSQNSVRIKVTSGNFYNYLNYPEKETIIKSSDLGNTSGSEIIIIKKLSSNININKVDENIAIATVDGNHDFSEGDVAIVDIDPDDSITETVYYISKRKYVELDLIPLSFNGEINDTGIGSSTMIGLGRDYVSGTYNNVELIFSNYSNSRNNVGDIGDSGNAKATVTVSNTNFDGSGQITSIVITDAGSGYLPDDILTIKPNSVPKTQPQDIDVNASLVYLNEDSVNGFTQYYFTVLPANYAAMEAALGAVGDTFTDDNNQTYTFVAKDASRNAFRYIPQGPWLLYPGDIIVDGVTQIPVDGTFTETPSGAPLPQYRFEVNGVRNPNYQMRVGGTFDFKAIPENRIFIVSDYTTDIASDGVALKVDPGNYTPVPGVTNNGVQVASGAPDQIISFTPTYPGTFYYLNIDHPEAVGIITVYPAPSTAIPLVSVDSVGLGVNRTTITLDKVYSLSVDDLLKIDNEIVKILAVNQTSKKITIQRGVNNTEIVNHPLNSKVTSYNPRYRFNPGDKIFGSTNNDPSVVSYDPVTHKLILRYDFDATNPREISLVSSFFDYSTPVKITAISSVTDFIERLEFSRDNINYEANPIVPLQKYYLYKFDTSHPSMIGAYFDISTSRNYNIFTEEKQVGPVEPGNPGAFVKIRIGYGPDLGGALERQDAFYSVYYYFLSNDGVDTGGAYLVLKDDPLSGVKNVVYTTDNKFVYSLDEVPQYDGTGDIRYTGRSIGKIASIALDNLGANYESLPIVRGVVPAEGHKCVVQAVRNAATTGIAEIKIIDPGNGYSIPEAVVSSGDGSGLRIRLQSSGGIITSAIVENPGTGYTFTPTIDIIETDNKIFFESSNIGIPQNVKFINYGQGYYSDNSLTPSFSSPQVFVMQDFDLDAFSPGEEVEQRMNGLVIAKGRVAANGWRKGSNILRLVDTTGVFRKGYSIRGNANYKTAIISDIKSTVFKPVVSSRARTLGKFNSDRGKVSSVNQRITDSFFYQDYSYVIRSRTPISEWRNAVKDTTHPAGFKLFGEVYLESQSSATIPQNSTSTKLTSYLILPSSVISSYTTSRTITTSILKVEDTNVRRGRGSAAVDSFDETLTRVRELVLTPSFDGRMDPSTGLKIGRTNFTILDKKTNTPYTPYNEQELMITIDGVSQNPGYSYVVTGNQIRFYEAPMGERQENIDGEDVLVPAQKCYIRSFKFRENSDNERYLKKIKNISDKFDGRTRIFDLYYEDGTIVKTDQNENLLIYLDGILQQASYEIRRFANPSKTDKLVFYTAPKKYKDFYDGDLPTQLDNRQYFYAYSVGNYERLGINQELIPYTLNNTYLVINKDNVIKNFDTPLYGYVFVNGVLQQDNISYKLVGPNIIFNQPLSYSLQGDGTYITDKVDILFFYGKDYTSTITLFDFEEDTFFNRATVTFTGANTKNTFDTWYSTNTSYKTMVYQLIDETMHVWGEVISSGHGSANNWQLDLRSQNIDLVPNSPVYFTRRTVSGTSDTISITFDSYTVEYLETVDQERILNRVESNYIPFLNTDSLTDSYEYRGEILREHPSLRPGDLIKIDGELDTREVFSVPLFAKSKEYREGYQVSNSFFAKSQVSSYDRDTLGQGLSVVAKLSNDSVSELVWNKRDLTQYFRNNILLNPTAYQYQTPPVLHFIPVDGNGGGAKAEVVVFGGQILDLIIIDGGSGYTKPPRVVVSRGYNVIRSNNYPESSFVIKLQTEEFTVPEAKIVSIISDIPLWKWNLIENVTTVIAPNPVDFENNVVVYITPPPVSVTIPGITYPIYTKQQLQKVINSPAPEAVEQPFETDYFLSGSVSYTTYEHPVTKYYSTGIIDMNESPVQNSFLYTQGKLGTTVGSFIDYIFMDVGYANVSGITLEQLEYTYTQFKGISEGVDTWMQNYAINNSSITSDGTLFNPGIPSIQELMSYLDADLQVAQTVAYIPDTTNFPSSGTILIGKELVSYTSKLPDRFAGLTRGVNGTPVELHPAGTLIRTVGLATT